MKDRKIELFGTTYVMLTVTEADELSRALSAFLDLVNLIRGDTVPAATKKVTKDAPKKKRTYKTGVNKKCAICKRGFRASGKQKYCSKKCCNAAAKKAYHAKKHAAVKVEKTEKGFDTSALVSRPPEGVEFFAQQKKA